MSNGGGVCSKTECKEFVVRANGGTLPGWQIVYVQNSESVRNMLGERGIRPEELPAEEDLQKVRRRLERDAKALSKSPLPPMID